jgi:hypothetical protein
MAVQYAFSQITTTGLKLAVDAADPLSYPGSGTSWTDVTGNGFTGTVSSSISFATTFRGALVSSNSSSAVSFSGSAANFGAGSFTVEMAFSPSVINGRHWLYSKNSGSFPNFGAFITGSGGSGRLTAFYNVSSTISCSATTAIGSIVTGSNYIVDVTYAPFNLFTGVYLNSNLVSNVGANGSGSLSTSASLLLLNNTTSSNSGTVGNLYNFKVYNPLIGSANIRKNYNSMCSRFGLPLALYTPPSPLLLDLYPGAAAAYSLRRLSDFYGGAAIQVRRSSDNVVLDIGFDGDGNLNTGALLSFCGVGNGFVTTWYDQSGNARNATQATAADQPQIVNNGSVILENAKPAIKFLASKLETATFTLSAQPITRIAVVKPNSINPMSFIDGSSTNRGRIGLDIENILFAGSPMNVGTKQAIYQLFYGLFNGASSEIIINGVLSGTGDPGTAGLDKVILGSHPFVRIVDLDGTMQEAIIYPSNQTTNRTAIESNINSFYSIY